MHLPSSLASVVDAPLLPHHRVSPQLVFTSARCPSPVACQISCLLGPLLTGYCRSDDVLHAGISSAHTYLPSGLAIVLRSSCCRKQWKLEALSRHDAVPRLPRHHSIPPCSLWHRSSRSLHDLLGDSRSLDPYRSFASRFRRQAPLCPCHRCFVAFAGDRFAR